MPVAFEVMGRDGMFAPGDEIGAATNRLDEIFELRDAGKLKRADYVRRLRALVEETPEFIDGYAHLSYMLLEEGKTQQALEAALNGMAIGDGVIPATFKGKVEWVFLENRPYLRALHGVVLSQLKLGQRQDALLQMQRMLKFNPNDNQGIRLMIGSEWLRAGERKKARSVLQKEAPDYPPCRYDLALLDWIEDDRVKAATNLRLGFGENVYIAETLTGSVNPMPIAIWHGSNFAQPDLATDYHARYGALWKQTLGALEFLRWLFTTSPILVERAAVQACREELLWTDDVVKRRTALEREEALRAAIDDRLSLELIQKRKHMRGKLINPWMPT
jgi:tetratricopeptide (TPR) repeat protein